MVTVVALLALDARETFDQTRTRQEPVVSDGRGSGRVVQGSREGTWPDAQKTQEQPLPEHALHASTWTSISNATCLTPLKSFGVEGKRRKSLFQDRRGVGVSRARGKRL